MRKFFITGVILLQTLVGLSQFTQDDVIYYVGDGPDTAVLVIDFIDETVDSSYAWGYLFDASVSTTAAEMLAAIAADEPKLTINAGGFLNDIYYNNHIGEAGLPNYWGTWSRTDETAWMMNGGISEIISNGDWFGCSYTDFSPASAPGEPIAAYKSTLFETEDVQFWVGSGSDSAVFVVDFVTAEYSEAVTYAWGFLFDGSTDGATMLAAIDASDVNLTVDASAFLNDLLFNGLEGLAGDPNYWATWSGTNLSDWVMNAGLSTTINNGDWFGCSYANWPPRRPFYPIAAIDSTAYLIDDVDFLMGSGENRVVLIIDFNESNPGQSFSYGYLFDSETVSAEEVLNAIAAYEPYGISVDLSGGFLNDIVSDFGYSGIAGDPNYWSTWSAKNVGGWQLNSGISETLENGDWFAATYTIWAPATPPSLPVNAQNTLKIEAADNVDVRVFPNPTSETLFLELGEPGYVQLINLQGQLISNEYYEVGVNSVDVSRLKKGVYFVHVSSDLGLVSQRIIIQ